MSPLAAKALEIAIAEIGMREDPPGSNRGPRVDQYIAAAGLDPKRGSYPWCACFLLWSIREAAEALDASTSLRPSARVLTLLQRNPELMLDRAEPGSIFIHLRPNTDGHTGFVTAVNDDWSIETVEGNTDSDGGRTGGPVRRQHRPADYATAYLAIREPA